MKTIRIDFQFGSPGPGRIDLIISAGTERGTITATVAGRETVADRRIVGIGGAFDALRAVDEIIGTWPAIGDGPIDRVRLQHAVEQVANVWDHRTADGQARCRARQKQFTANPRPDHQEETAS